MIKNKADGLFYGCDISTWNKDYPADADFVMVRAGAGYQTDSRFYENMKLVESRGTPYGFYWASYALGHNSVSIEAKLMLDICKHFNPTYPIAFDYEYFSMEYYRKEKGLNVSRETMIHFADIFLSTIEQHGYYAINYTNIDLFRKAFSDASLNRFDRWVAQWSNIEKPAIKCGMWQYTNKPLDLNVAYKNYPKIIEKAGLNVYVP